MGSISKRLKSLIQSNQSVDPRDSIDPVKSDSNGLSPEDNWTGLRDKEASNTFVIQK
jgi:hypothetical protein